MPELGGRERGDTIADHDEILAHGDRLWVVAPQIVEDVPDAPADPIARDGGAGRPPDGEGDSDLLGAGSLQMDDGEPVMPDTGAVRAEPLEGRTVADSSDQADSRALPLRRRALMMERPARVDMR